MFHFPKNATSNLFCTSINLVGIWLQSSRRKLKIQYFIAFFLYCLNVYLKTKLTVSYTAMPLSELCHRFNIIHRFLLRSLA